MWRILWVSFCFLAPAAIAAPAESPQLPFFADSIQVVDDQPFLMPVAFDRAVRVRFPVGELEIVAADVAEVRTALNVRCDRLSEALCAKYKGKLRLEGEDRDGVVEVRLVGLPKWKLRKLQLDGTVTVPRWAPLEVRVGIGDVDIYAGDMDLAVRMGIGDLTITVPEERVGSVHAATRIGDASLRGVAPREGRRRMLIGATVDWTEGSGPIDIAVGLKIGDASVVLE
jgi:hypothetical protein